MTNESECIFLLLPESVDVGKEQGDVVATYEGHEPGVVEAFHQRLLFLSIGGFIRGFAGINCFIRYNYIAVFSRLLAFLLDVVTHHIYLTFGKEVSWIIERWAVTSGTTMLVMEISIGGHMNVPSCSKGLAENSSAEAHRTLLNKDLCTACGD